MLFPVSVTRLADFKTEPTFTVVYKPHPVIERLKQAESHVSKKSPPSSEDPGQEEKKDSFEMESTKIFTNID